MTTISRGTGRYLLAALAAASAILAAAPVAGAEEPSPECPAQTEPAGDPPPCEQQQQGQGMPNMPKLPKNSDNGNPGGQAKQVDLSDKNCWVVNGAPVIYVPGTLATGPGDVVSWCPTTYGLTPH